MEDNPGDNPLRDPQVDLALEQSKLERKRLSRRVGRRKCCRCNGNGSCVRCECASSRRECVDCLPRSKNRCANFSAHENPLSSTEQVGSEFSPETRTDSQVSLLLERVSLERSLANERQGTVPPTAEQQVGLADLPLNEPRNDSEESGDQGLERAKSTQVLFPDEDEAPLTQVLFSDEEALDPPGVSSSNARLAPGSSLCDVSCESGPPAPADVVQTDARINQNSPTSSSTASVPDNGRSVFDIDSQLEEVYGDRMLNGPGRRVRTDCWFQWWERAVRLPFRRYDLPGGNIGRRFVDILTKEVELLASLKECSERLVVFQFVILQKEVLVTKTADVRRLISKRLEMWAEGSYGALFSEAVRASQSHGKRLARSSTPREHDHTIRVFHRLIIQGKLRSAVRWITDRDQNGLLSASDMTMAKNGDGDLVNMTVLDALRLKHPEPAETSEEACPSYPDTPDLIDLDITGGHIQTVARSLRGGAGPGGSDAAAWQDWLLRYGAHSERLRDSVAHLARTLANSPVPWESIRALMANRLIALDKCPGVRPIGIGESLRRVLGKTIMLVAGADVQIACGADQLCAGLEAGIEAAIHSLNDIFEEQKDAGWGVLLLDASNAFNALNRKAALWQARHLWPRGCRFLFNTYKGWAALVLAGSDCLLYSKEGTTQGDPLSMAFYAIGVLPLIRDLKDLKSWIQVWYADDSNCAGKLKLLRVWLDTLIQRGPAFGYFPEPSKSTIVVDPTFVQQAQAMFSDLGVLVTTSHRLLGGHIGSAEGCSVFVQRKVESWAECVSRLSEVAEQQPQDAYAALTKSLASEWNFLQRVISGCGPAFQPVEDKLAHSFLPSLFGCEVSMEERSLFELPVRCAGLALSNPTSTATSAYSTSLKAANHLRDAIVGRVDMDVGCHRSCVTSTRLEARSCRRREHQKQCGLIVQGFEQNKQRTIKRAMEHPIGAWLLMLPNPKNDSVLSPREFRDGLAMRYQKPLLQMPGTCDGCGALFSLEHGLNCANGGNLIRRHNEVRDVAGQLAALAFPHVTKEPVVREGSCNQDGLICDLAVRGVWNPQTEALFDVRVVNTDAQSYATRPVIAVLDSIAKAKKAKHHQACMDRRADFTPFITSTDGVLHREAEHFLKRLAARLSDKWIQPYSQVMHFVRARLNLATLRATVHCVRGARRKMASLNLEDGAAMSLMYAAAV